MKAVARIVILTALCGLAGRAAEAESWPTLHRDNQRSGFYPARIPGPFERKWHRDFAEDMVGARVEAIVADGLCVVPTYSGLLAALKVTNGETAWLHQAPGPIIHSPAASDGMLFVTSDDRYDRGTVACLDIRTGRPLWSVETAAGIRTSPLAEGRRVFVADTVGTVHALEAATGAGIWTFPTGAMVLAPPSATPDGERILVASEDMHVYCLNAADGSLVWRSPRLQGLSLRDHGPTVWRDKVIVRTNPAFPFHEALYAGRDLLARTHRQAPRPPDGEIIRDTVNMFYLTLNPEREARENRALRQALETGPHLRSWYTLELNSGREAWVPPVWFTSGLHNPPSPPVFNPETGRLYTLLVTALSPCADGVSQTGIAVGEVDPRTGDVSRIPHAGGPDVPGYFKGFTVITDETSTLSLMGDFLLATHQGAVGGIDLTTGELRTLHGARDSYAGIFGPGVHGGWDRSRELAEQGCIQNAVNEWHGPDRGCVSIADSRIFWVAGGQIVCFAPPSVEPAHTGLTQAPDPARWRADRRFDGGNLTASLPKALPELPPPLLTPQVVRALAAEPADPPDGPPDDPLLRALDKEVAEVVENGLPQPWIVELGISKEEVHFFRAADTIGALSRALPYLGNERRAEVLALLDALIDAGFPLREAVPAFPGPRREWYEVPPALAERAPTPRSAPGLGDLHAVWAYARYGGRRDRIAARADAIRELFRQATAAPFRFDPRADRGRAVAGLNGEIAGLIGYSRLMRMVGDDAAAEEAVDPLRERLLARIRFERTDAAIQSPRDHHADIPRYLNLVPELGAILRAHAGDAVRANVEAADRELKVWHQAWGERLIGGENYTNSPNVARALFAAKALGTDAPVADLRQRLDHPWCAGDLYYIEKLIAVREAAGRMP